VVSDIVREMDQAIVDALPQPRRPMAPCKWFGGKGNLARWIVRHLPRDGVQVYCEPYAGMASVLWHLPDPYPVEVLNDLDKRIVNLFRVLQDEEQFQRLVHRLIWTPYARDEFVRALDMLERWDEIDTIDRAWAFFVAQNMAVSGTPNTAGNWSRALISAREMAETANKWRGRMKLLTWWHDRLTRVQIDCREALDVIRYWDRDDALFYVDPPYVHNTRKDKRVYAYEQDDAHHEALVDMLLGIRGRAVVSGYDHPIYRRLEAAGWRRVERETAAWAAGRVRGSKLLGDGAAKRHARRVEVLWLHPRIPMQGELGAD